MNHITISGRLGRDCEIKYTGSGKAVANLSVAVKKERRGAGEEPPPIWVTVVAWENRAQIAAGFKKGDLVLVSGRLDVREWQDKSGQKKVTTEVVAEEIAKIPLAGTTRAANRSETEQPPIDDEDIPF